LMIISAVVLLGRLIDETCVNHVYGEVVSPGDKYKAVIFQRDCGATTGFSTQISILEVDAALKNSSGNIYIVDGLPEMFVPKIKWEGDQKLIIQTLLDGNRHKAERRRRLTDEIEISYSANGS